MPVVWWMLGVLAYPVLYLLARWHRRHAERIERDFTALLGRDQDELRRAADGRQCLDVPSPSSPSPWWWWRPA